MREILKHWTHILAAVAVLGLTVAMLMDNVSAEQYVALVMLFIGADVVALKKQRTRGGKSK